jgi:hypothetical protein
VLGVDPDSNHEGSLACLHTLTTRTLWRVYCYCCADPPPVPCTGAAEPRSVRLPAVDALLQRVCCQRHTRRPGVVCVHHILSSCQGHVPGELVFSSAARGTCQADSRLSAASYESTVWVWQHSRQQRCAERSCRAELKTEGSGNRLDLMSCPASALAGSPLSVLHNLERARPVCSEPNQWPRALAVPT